MKICLHCQTVFKPKRKEQEYCCRSCASVKKGQSRSGQNTGQRKNWEYQERIDKDGYVRCYGVLHPYSNGRKMMQKHIMVMELQIGRQIQSDEVVHHKNGNRQDNRLENLELMTRSEHSKMHGPTMKRGRNQDGRFA